MSRDHQRLPVLSRRLTNNARIAEAAMEDDR